MPISVALVSGDATNVLDDNPDWGGIGARRQIRNDRDTTARVLVLLAHADPYALEES